MGLDARGHEEIRQGHHALCAPDVLGRARRPDGAAARSRTRRALRSRSTTRRCASRTAFRSRCRRSGGRPRKPRRSTPRPAAFIRTTRAPCSRRNRAASTIASCATCRQRRRARQFQRVHGQGRRRVHADPERHLSRRHHAPARRSGCCARPACRWSRRCCAMPTSRPPTRSSRPATPPRCCRSPASASASLQPGPFYRKARELYWAFAHSSG